MRIPIGMCVILVATAGCSEQANREYLAYRAYCAELEKLTPIQVQVITEPPGAHISVNGDYAGKSPCTVTMWKDYWNHCNRDYEIVASPVIDGQYLQSRWFRGAQDPVPSKVFFDMALRMLPPQVDVNVR